MVIGAKNIKKKMVEELEKNPLTLGGSNMKQTGDYVYLGTVISEDGLLDSTTMSIKRKAAKVKHLVYEIKSVVEHCRGNVPGAFCTAVHIWNSSVVPYLYYGAENWDVSKSTMKILYHLEEYFYLSILEAPCSTLKPGLYWQVAATTPENRIIEMKLKFIFF